MKKLRLIFCLLLLSISLAGCGGKKEPDTELITINGREFIRIDTEEPFWYLVIDKESKVQYIYISSGYRAGLTCLVDADGKPILYEGSFE